MTKTNYDIKARYDLFNQLYFDGKMPAITLRFAKLKSVGGLAKVAKGGLRREGLIPTRGEILRGVSKYRGVTANPRFVSITLSNMFDRPDDQYDAILLHEMIHAYFYLNGPIDANHGPLFKAMRAKLARLSGIDIPMTDSTKGLELSQPTAKSFGVILAEHDGRQSITVMSAAKANAYCEKIKARWAVKPGRSFTKVSLWTIATPEWSAIGTRYPSARDPLAFRTFKCDAEDAQALRQSGKCLWEIDYEDARKKADANDPVLQSMVRAIENATQGKTGVSLAGMSREEIRKRLFGEEP